MGAVFHHCKVVVICYTVWKMDTPPSSVSPQSGQGGLSSRALLVTFTPCTLISNSFFCCCSAQALGFGAQASLVAEYGLQSMQAPAQGLSI